MDWLYPLSGFVVGAIVGLTGMGGGSLMTPLLILLFGVHPLTAVGTDLLYAAATKTAGTAIHSKKGNVDWRVAGLLAAGSVPTTVLTIWVLSRVPKQSPTTATIISMSMGVALIIAAVAIFLRGRIRDYALARGDNPTRTRYSSPITVVFSAMLGVACPLARVGKKPIRRIRSGCSSLIGTEQFSRFCYHHTMTIGITGPRRAPWRG